MENLATVEKVNGQIQKAPTLQSLLTQENVKKRFEEMLGKKAAGFISSIISATKANDKLQAAEPNSIISAAVIAATLDLPIQNNLGFAAIVPYGNQAQFQMMWRGYVQLAMRTAQYTTINVSEVYEGELLKENRITGEYIFDTSKKSSDKIIGYVAYFKMVNGFEKYLYWTVAQVQAHGKKYSKTFGHSNGRWTLDFDAMAKKTVLKLLLGRFGILSVDMQIAITADQGVVKDADTVDIDYVDNTKEEVDKELERVTLLLSDCKTADEVDRLQEQCPAVDAELFNKRKEELTPVMDTEKENEILLNIENCETIAQLKEVALAYPTAANLQWFKNAYSSKHTKIGKALKK